MIDLLAQLPLAIRQVAREATADDEIVRVTMTRTYATSPDDLWDALTQPERIARWFMPITGDLTPGGHFQLVGNADGDVLACEPPRQFRVTFGGPTSFVTVTLTANGDGTELVLDHSVPLAMAQSVAGALFVGPGWDGALLGLAIYVAGDAQGDPTEAANSAEAIEYSRASIALWADVAAASGASADEVAAARAMSSAQFDPEG